MPNDIIDAIESDVTALAERDDLTADDLCLLLTKLDGIAKRTRDAKAQLENFLLTWLPTQPVKELQIGEVRYYVGPKSKEKCRNVPAAVTALYEATGGDYEAFCDCLSANALKHGACRKVLGDAYADHFETTTELDILTGKPAKALKQVNANFLR
jgi:hypothetical protein